MKLKKSVHFKDALVQTSSNAGRAMTIIEKYSKKWNISKTIVHTRNNGMEETAYVDSQGNCVYLTFPNIPGRWKSIGERIESKDHIELA